MSRCVALIALVLLSSCAAAAPDTTAKQAMATLGSLVGNDGPGAAILIAKGDKILIRSARGKADIELGVPLTPNSTFRIASVTKMFTAAMVVKLSEEKKLSLDDHLSACLPDFPNAGQITIRQLLNHTSGISDKVVDPQPGFSAREVDTATLLAQIGKRPPAFAPGTRRAYSNAGYIVLGAVVEKVTGQTWHAAIEERLLKPLGLTHTFYGAAAPIIVGRAAGYTTQDHTVVNAPYISASTPAAAGGLVSTLDDLFHWMRALSHGRVVSAQGFAKMTNDTSGLSELSFDYGFGLYLWRVRGHVMVGHTGQIDGFASAAVYVPDQDITVVVLANDDDFDARTMARRLSAIALGEPYILKAAAIVSDAHMQAIAGAYRIDANTIETITLHEHKLFAQRSNRNTIPLQMTADVQLHFVPDELTYFMPVRGSDGQITALDRYDGGDGPPVRLSRIP